LLVLGIGINAAWAVRISGTVITGDDNKPAAGASVRAYASSDNTKFLTGDTVDENGKFDFDVPDANALVVIHQMGQTDQNFTPSELNGRTIVLQTNPTMLNEVVVTATRPTGGDGCDDEKNDRITAALALCSVHAYNLGLSSNPTGADKQLMKEIVALKTTVIAQQMNKQYEYMETMIRRFKTQLEKAVLTTKLQAAGAAPSSSSDGSASGGGYSGGGSGGSSGVHTNRGLANAEDCASSYSSSSEVMQCLLRNLSKTSGAIASGDLGTARRQLKQDQDVLKIYSHSSLESNAICKTALGTDNGDCAKALSGDSNRNTMTSCLSAFRGCVIKNTEAIAQQNNQPLSRQ